MKRTTTIVLFASIFAVAVGTLGLSGSSASTLMTAGSQSPEQVGMLGHVEYKLMDDSGNVIQYLQGDNVVVNDGEDCAADAIFGDGTCVGTIGTNYFNYIGIGNGTSTDADGDATNATLQDDVFPDDNVGKCADAAEDGEMARRQVTATHTAASGTTGAVVELDTSSVPFTFDASNATVVMDSGVFNANFAGATADEHQCQDGSSTDDGGTAGTDWDMFSRQLLNGLTGITVSQGDSLSVKWTITVG